MIKFLKLSPNAKIPARATAGAAGFDIYAQDQFETSPGKVMTIKTGIAVIIPDGYVGIIRSRSGLHFKHGVDVFHGTIDADFRGEIVVSLWQRWSVDPVVIKQGQAFAQIVVMPYLGDAIEIDQSEFDQAGTERGAKGLGSTDQPDMPKQEGV